MRFHLKRSCSSASGCAGTRSGDRHSRLHPVRNTTLASAARLWQVPAVFQAGRSIGAVHACPQASGRRSSGVEHTLGKGGVGGSIPLGGTTSHVETREFPPRRSLVAPRAQSAERCRNAQPIWHAFDTRRSRGVLLRRKPHLPTGPPQSRTLRRCQPWSAREKFLLGEKKD